MDATKERDLEGARIDQAKAVEVAIIGGATVEDLEKPKPFPDSLDWPMSGDDLAILRAGRVRNWTPQPQPNKLGVPIIHRYEFARDASVDNAARPDDPTDDAAFEQPGGQLDVEVLNSTVQIDTEESTGSITVVLNDAVIYQGDPTNDETAVELLWQATEAYRNGDHLKLNALLR